MAVDRVLHLGFFQTHLGGDALRVYDLKAMKPGPIVPLDAPLSDDAIALDPVHHRVFFRQSGAQVNCGQASLYIFDERALRFSHKQIPCMGADGSRPDAFDVRGISYYAPTNKLYVAGSSGAEIAAFQGSGLSAYHESL